MSGLTPIGPGTTTAERTEVLQPGPAEALAGLLNVTHGDLEVDGLPLMWHWVYLLDRAAQRDLGPDGHPIRGSVPAPPAPGQRRMWAGGRVTSLAPLRIGLPATRVTSVQSVVQKRGRTGALTFVEVLHKIRQDGRTAVEERQDLVYRDRGAPTSPVDPSARLEPIGPDDWTIDVTPTLLFRFSALTYNAHRIHYDREYATQAEGYPGLVTHGPLQALAMAEAARTRGVTTDGGLTCDYRLVSPLFEDQGLVTHVSTRTNGVEAVVRDIRGRTTAQATFARS